MAKNGFKVMDSDMHVQEPFDLWLNYIDPALVFSTDFPHADSRFPHAVDTLLEQPFPEASNRKILWDNCARLYAFN